VRYLDYDNNQLAGGQNIWSLKLTADYAFSKNLTAIFYYDHSFSKAVISTSFPLTNIRSDLRFDIILGIKFIKI
jgi:cell surface protein SprA